MEDAALVVVVMELGAVYTTEAPKVELVGRHDDVVEPHATDVARWSLRDVEVDPQVIEVEFPDRPGSVRASRRF
jgi:hypothetical protein